MPSDLSALEFALDDVIGGQRLSPETVDLPTLRGFLAEVEKLIKGDVLDASLSDSRVRIEDGSVKIVAMVAQMLAADVRADFARLAETGDLDQMQPSRAKVIESWQVRARSTPTRSYLIRSETGVAPLRVENQSQFQHGGENAWVTVEKYLTGQVVDAGGKQDPNIHLVLIDSDETVKVDATKAQLTAEKENQLYKFVTLRVQAEQHLRTHKLRDIRLIQFLPHENDPDERALATLWQKGRDAWKKVSSATGWVEDMRGHSRG